MKPVAAYFTDPNNLTPALVHRSYCNEHPGLTSNERLEFLGDSVLSLIISKRLYKLFPNVTEGELTSRRSLLVQTSSLAEKAKFLGLDQLLLLSKGEADLGGRKNPSLLANTFEAVLGAIFESDGLSACEIYLEAVFPDSEIIAFKDIKDPKSQLQEKIQAQKHPAPTYKLLASHGPDHSKIFTVSVSIADSQVATGTGKSIQKAETAAAAAALAKLTPQMVK